MNVKNLFLSACIAGLVINLMSCAPTLEQEVEKKLELQRRSTPVGTLLSEDPESVRLRKIREDDLERKPPSYYNSNKRKEIKI